MIDLENFREEYDEALSQATEFARRRRKGLPADRWATERQMHLVAKGIDAMTQIMTWQADMLKQFAESARDSNAA